MGINTLETAASSVFKVPVDTFKIVHGPDRLSIALCVDLLKMGPTGGFKMELHLKTKASKQDFPAPIVLKSMQPKGTSGTVEFTGELFGQPVHGIYRHRPRSGKIITGTKPA